MCKFVKYISCINGLYREDSSGTRQYYLYNGHGDVVQLGNSSGAVTKTYTYDSFGNEKNIDANDTNPMRYCGEYYDKETGTIYLRARYYDAGIGRFISEDSVRGKANDPLSLNLYTYCTNNPVMYGDPSGYNPATRKVGSGAMSYYTFVPDVRLSNQLIAFGGIVPFGSTIVESVSDLLSGQQTISNYDIGSVLKGSGSELLDTLSIAESTSDGIKVFGKFSSALTVYDAIKETIDKSPEINQIINIMYGDMMWAKTRENLIAKYLKFFDLVEAFVKDGAVTYNTDLAGYVTDLSIDQEKVNKIISDKNIDFESIQKQYE